MKLHSPYLFCLTVLLLMVTAVGFAHASAMFTATAPTIDGVVSASEWDDAVVEFDTGSRPDAACSINPWDVSGCKARFMWDNTNVYGLIEAYPNTGVCGNNANGPFDDVNWEVYINAVGDGALFLDGQSPTGGQVVAFGTSDPHVPVCVPSYGRMVIEFSIPIVEIIESNPMHAFNPTGGDFFEYRIRTTDTDTAEGFDSRDQTCGWVTEPQETSGGYRKLVFSPAVPIELSKFSVE